MRGKSHICLGKYLVKQYLKDISPRHARAFLIGCIEPDRNPFTYLKGSFRFQWLRGHNYWNARRFLRRISVRLEKKKKWNMFDYYTLGKLIHYTADAFTSAHNENFSKELAEHRQYEADLQEHFLLFLQQDPRVDFVMARRVMDVISSYHRLYEQHETNIHLDSWFALTACCCVLAVLVSKQL